MMANQFEEQENTSETVPGKKGPGRPPKVAPEVSQEASMQARIDEAVQKAVAAALATVGRVPLRPASEQPESLLEPKEVRQRKGAVILAEWEREAP
ncbi:MAG TPA: hypothetical protein VG815_02695 [Chloroflexota bacterium]|jgi:hypothetical protein|nr:hypothetical protein [Chloroflexota bacterium]